jgi:photosystem II stability/assembly factor-like uncharacterized protein
MNRIVHLILALSVVGLLAILLALTVSVQPSARAAGNIIKVPDDYPTIQAAIDAATDGDTILVAEGLYEENLSLTEGITLSGGWDVSFTVQAPGMSTIDAQGLGRAISVTCATSDTVVTIDGFTIASGNATGLGGPPVALSEGDWLQGASKPASPASDDRAPAERVADLRARLADLAARGLYPGGEAAYQATLARLDRLVAQAEQAAARPRSTEADDAALQPGDCGGGVYSWNASLHLLNCTVQGNLASTTGNGYGGGVFAGQAPPGGVRIAGNTLHDNIASAGSVPMAQGVGGALYVCQAPGAVIADNVIRENAASSGGVAGIGIGGGLVVEASLSPVVRGNQIERNTAGAGWGTLQGLGGGAYLRYVSGAVVTDNVFQDNLGVLYGAGGSGGLILVRSQDVLVADNTATGNWGCLFQPNRTNVSGGGFSLHHVTAVTVTGNTLLDNVACVSGPRAGDSFGGGIDAQLFFRSSITSNTITGNVAAQTGIGWGGGVSLWAAEDSVVADNTLTGNAGSLSGLGGGGGVFLRNTDGSQVYHNRFQDNRGAGEGTGSGGALRVEGEGPYSFNTTVDANLFLDNQACVANPSEPSVGGACIVGTDGFTFTNNVVAGNTADLGGGVALEYAPRGVVVNNTLVGNGDTAILVDQWNITPITLTNNIVVSHTVGISVTEGATATVRYTLWNGNGTDIAGGGTISHTHPVTGAPAFVDPAADDYHIGVGSAARDAGDPAGVPPAPDHDADGVARPQGPAVDLGTYEWRGHWWYLPLVFKSFTPRVGWAIGYDATGTAVIVHTADSGLTWQMQGDSAAWTGLDGCDISAVDDQTAWAALGSGPGETQGTILHTTDGGATWVTQTIPAGLAGGIKGVKGLSRSEAWAASLGGVILHTTDGGATWNIVPHPTVPITQVNRMDALGTNVWIADAATGGAVVHTQDGGITWRAESLPNDSALTVHAFSLLAVWGSGSYIDLNPSFYRTVDGGDQWVKVKEVGALDHLDDVCAASPDDAWGVVNGDGVSGSIWRVHVATDGTPEAKNVSPPELAGYTPGGVTCLDTSVAWVVAQKGVYPDPTKPLGIILHMVDGEHWVQQSAPTQVRYWKVSFVGARR